MCEDEIVICTNMIINIDESFVLRQLLHTEIMSIYEIVYCRTKNYWTKCSDD